MSYPNLKYINDSLKQYRKGEIEGLIQESREGNDQYADEEIDPIQEPVNSAIIGYDLLSPPN